MYYLCVNWSYHIGKLEEKFFKIFNVLQVCCTLKNCEYFAKVVLLRKSHSG